jgi:hypothetical protein
MVTNIHLFVNGFLGGKFLLDFFVHSHSEVENLLHSFGEGVLLDYVEVV